VSASPPCVAGRIGAYVPSTGFYEGTRRNLRPRCDQGRSNRLMMPGLALAVRNGLFPVVQPVRRRRRECRLECRRKPRIAERSPVVHAKPRKEAGYVVRDRGRRTEADRGLQIGNIRAGLGDIARLHGQKLAFRAVRPSASSSSRTTSVISTGVWLPML
jgi:hypothetical protein